MKSSLLPTLDNSINSFDFDGEIVGALPYGEGHINNTFCVYTQQKNGDCKRYILQRISDRAFKEPEKLMENIVGVTEFLKIKIVRQGGDVERETLSVVRTKDDRPLFYDGEGRTWRAYDFIEDAVCLQKAETAELFYQSSRAFGNFQRLLADYPAETLHDTIEKFHDTENRLRLRLRPFKRQSRLDWNRRDR